MRIIDYPLEDGGDEVVDEDAYMLNAVNFYIHVQGGMAAACSFSYSEQRSGGVLFVRLRVKYSIS